VLASAVERLPDCKKASSTELTFLTVRVFRQVLFNVSRIRGNLLHQPGCSRISEGKSKGGTVISMNKLTPRVLGKLVALDERSLFTHRAVLEH